MSGRGPLPAALYDVQVKGETPRSSPPPSSLQETKDELLKPPQTIVNNHEILYFDKNDQWSAAKDPLHFESPQYCGVGPGLTFASELCQMNFLPANSKLQKQNKRKIGLIPCAVGGTSIDEWLPASSREEKDGREIEANDTIKAEAETDESRTNTKEKAALSSSPSSLSSSPSLLPPLKKSSKYFDLTLKRVVLAKSKYSNPNEINIKGILWHQGESDSGALEDAKAHLNKLLALFAAFREALNDANIPILVGGLGTFLGQREDIKYRYYAIVNEALAEVPRRLYNTAYVSSEGLTHKGDSLHFSTESAQELGIRYAQAYARLSGARVHQTHIKQFRAAVARTSTKAIEKTKGVF
ncbi:hypothetical protein RFI_15977 [Reticulomyxa filosa]|uniref:Sialate O-acetylesterase domain-containing protein n=1 Tax=Reticulomyxa filosa TaxID=46433 RepID=X6N7D7_RETFI|nr:hypothetical protein RFI_15977 [Reticulomyxa filosa]|eukprot:ETO21227.1 hypothetical protein RFI_15977 [Reticulomyxa filosa]